MLDYSVLFVLRVCLSFRGFDPNNFLKPKSLYIHEGINSSLIFILYSMKSLNSKIRISYSFLCSAKHDNYCTNLSLNPDYQRVTINQYLALQTLNQMANCHPGWDGMRVDDDVRCYSLTGERHVLQHKQTRLLFHNQAKFLWLFLDFVMRAWRHAASSCWLAEN